MNISTVKKLTVSAVIAGYLGLALGGVALTVAAPANAATNTTSSVAKWSVHGEGEETIRVSDAARI